MSVAYVTDHFDVSRRPVVPVWQERDLNIGMCVSGTVVSRYRLHGGYFSYTKEPVWGVEVLLEGGLKGAFGCKQSDMDIFKEFGAVEGQTFTAIISSGIGPAPGGLDLEPTSVFYLSDIALGPSRPAVRAVIVAGAVPALDMVS